MATEELKIVLTAENKKLISSLNKSQAGLKQFSKSASKSFRSLEQTTKKYQDSINSMGNKSLLLFGAMSAGLGVFLNTAGNFEQ